MPREKRPPCSSVISGGISTINGSSPPGCSNNALRSADRGGARNAVSAANARFRRRPEEGAPRGDSRGDGRDRRSQDGSQNIRGHAQPASGDRDKAATARMGSGRSREQDQGARGQALFRINQEPEGAERSAGRDPAP